MNPKANKITMSEWLTALQEAKKPDVIPPGWKSVKMIADELGKAESTTRCLVRGLLYSNKAERRVFKVPCSDGYYRPCPHYRLKPA